MPDDPYSIMDLSRLADVTPRTIRYYVAQGLLPAPESAGPATRYGDGHLVRLRLIRRLQRDHLPLAEIRIRLERMRDEDVQALLDATASVAPDPARTGKETLSYVQALMAKAGVPPRVPDGTRESSVPYMNPPARLTRSIPGAAALHALKPATGAPPAGFYMDASETIAPRSVAGDRSTWERLVISADVELHVRRPLDRVANKRVDQLARIARELFDEES
jgi:DNA-binding transcriptional MerR regulator